MSADAVPLPVVGRGRYGTALAQAQASLAQPDRAVLVAALESLAEATNALARVLAG
jgi:hypothetical protein